MSEIRVNPTRMELKKLKTRLTTARRGHKLLKDKCDELMKQFLDLVREDRALREKTEEKIARVHAAFASASALTSPEMLSGALLLPKKEGAVEVTYQNRMSVVSPRFAFDYGKDLSDYYNYGYASTPGELDEAMNALAALIPEMLALAEKEKAAQMLASEIEKTRRRVNALEYIMIPDLETAIKSISMKLDENERGNTTRLMKVKEMVLNEKQTATEEEEE